MIWHHVSDSVKSNGPLGTMTVWDGDEGGGGRRGGGGGWAMGKDCLMCHSSHAGQRLRPHGSAWCVSRDGATF